MKDNKEFIRGIYKKYDEYQEDKLNNKRTKKYMYLLSMAVVFIIVFAFSFYEIRLINNQKPIIIDTQLEDENPLAKVETFQTFYEIMKNQETESNITKGESLISDVTTNSIQSESRKHSDTNVQVEGVDEADVIKTDGRYIYYIANKKIIIVDIQDTANSNKKIAEISFEDENISLRELYVRENKLIVITSEQEIRTEVTSIYENADVSYVDGIKLKTTAIVYDISNRENPEEKRRVAIEGTYISSRMIGDNIYFTTNKYITNLIGMLKKYPIEELNENDYKPVYVDTAINNEEKYINFNEIRYFDDKDVTNYLIVTGFNINNMEEADVQAFLGAGQTIYCSIKNMYIAKIKTIYDINTYSLLGYQTRIVKFGLENGKFKYKKDTTVEGKILNQFSMDEDKDENLRVAVTQEKQQQTENILYVLDNNLQEIGNLGELANGENIYSVRYMGDKGYIVTYKQVDPLFVIDLSDPKNPQKLGELKIPGYSTYLHPYDENHIIGFGYDTNADGTRNRNNGLKLSLFDVKDVNNPKELFTQKIGNLYTSSDVLYNHKAIMYLNEKNIVAFPIQNYQGNTNISQALIYEINLQQGFVLKVKYSQDYKNSYDKRIQRIVYANDKYYLVSNENIIIMDENTWQEIGKIEIK